MSAVQKLPASQRLSQFTDEADKIFNHILGYVIAFTSLVAFADVLGNGKITQYLPWVFWLWVLAQGLCVEFQVFILIRRLPRLWKVNQWMFTGNIAFILCLCVMSVFIGSVFVQHDNAGGTIEQAMYSLGINHTLFIYARSALAILLVVLIAVDRALDHQEFSEQVNLVNTFEEKLRTFSEQQSEHLNGRLAQFVATEQQSRQVLANSVQDMLNTFRETQEHVDETCLAAITQAVEQRLAEMIQSERHARADLLEVFTREVNSIAQVFSEQQSEHLQREQVNTGKIERVNTSPVHSSRISLLPLNTDNKKERVHKFLEDNPTATVSEVVDATGCSRGYASEQRNVFLSEQQSEHLLVQEGS